MAKILLAEDDDSMRDFLAKALKRAGHEVLVCSDGEEGLDAIGEQPAQFDLLLTDIVMPVMGGFRMVETLKEINPNIKVAMMTGYPGGSPSDGHFVEDKYRIITKPFKPEELRSVISKILDLPEA